MNRALRIIGRTFYWATLPLLIVYIRRSHRVRLFVAHDGHVLVVRPWHGNGKWCLPGGGVHKNESNQSGALRELKEETGISLSPDALKSLGTFVYTQHKLNFVYELFGAQVHTPLSLRRQRGEIAEVAWVPAKSLTAHNSNQDVLSALALKPR